MLSKVVYLYSSDVKQDSYPKTKTKTKTITPKTKTKTVTLKTKTKTKTVTLKTKTKTVTKLDSIKCVPFFLHLNF